MSDAEKYRAALDTILGQAQAFENEASRLYGGDSPQRLWAWGLATFIEETLREREDG